MIVNRAFEPDIARRSEEQWTLLYCHITLFFSTDGLPYALRTQRPHTFTSFAAWKSAARLLDDVCPEGGTNKDRDVLAEWDYIISDMQTNTYNAVT